MSKDLSTTVLLDVGGMKCAGCSSAVQRMLSAEPGVERAVVNLVTETAAVQYKSDVSSAMQMATAAAEKVHVVLSSCTFSHEIVRLVFLTESRPRLNPSCASFRPGHVERLPD